MKTHTSECGTFQIRGSQAPRLEELEAERFVVERGQEPWVVSVTASAKRLDEVKVTWDIIGRSVHVRWLKDDRDVLVLERETVSRIGITSALPLKKRPASQVSACTKYFSQACTFTWVAQSVPGRCNAGRIEYIHIRAYRVKYGHCPPGQRYSCS